MQADGYGVGSIYCPVKETEISRKNSVSDYCGGQDRGDIGVLSIDMIFEPSGTE